MKKLLLVTLGTLVIATFSLVFAGNSASYAREKQDECQGECLAYDWQWQCKHSWHGVCLKWEKVKVCTEYENLCVEPEPTPTPEPSVEPTATPEVTVRPAPNYFTSPPLGACFGKWDWPITQAIAERTSPTTALIDYVPTTGEGEHLNVVYSESWFDVVTGLGAHGLRDWMPNNGQDVPLNDLVPGQTYYYRLQNGCSMWG